MSDNKNKGQRGTPDIRQQRPPENRSKEREALERMHIEEEEKREKKGEWKQHTPSGSETGQK